MALHRQTPDPILPQPELQVLKDGRVQLNTTEYDQMLEYRLNQLRLSHFFFPRVGGAWYTNIYFLWHTPLLRRQTWYGIQIFDNQLRLTPQFKATFGEYLRKMTDHFRKKGWLDKVYITTMDEPKKPSDLRAVAEFSRFVKSVAPDLKLFCTTYPRPELFGAIDAWCPQRYDAETVRRRLATGEELIFYKNWLHLIDMPIVNPRLSGWIA